MVQRLTSPDLKIACKATEWEYLLTEGAVEIYEGVPSQGKQLLSRDPEQLKQESGVEGIFCNIIDIFSSRLKLNNNPGIALLKDYFIKGKGLEANFDLKVLLKV